MRLGWEKYYVLRFSFGLSGVWLVQMISDPCGFFLYLRAPVQAWVLRRFKGGVRELSYSLIPHDGWFPVAAIINHKLLQSSTSCWKSANSFTHNGFSFLLIFRAWILSEQFQETFAKFKALKDEKKRKIGETVWDRRSYLFLLTVKNRV